MNHKEKKILTSPLEKLGVNQFQLITQKKKLVPIQKKNYERTSFPLILILFSRNKFFLKLFIFLKSIYFPSSSLSPRRKEKKLVHQKKLTMKRTSFSLILILFFKNKFFLKTIYFLKNYLFLSSSLLPIRKKKVSPLEKF